MLSKRSFLEEKIIYSLSDDIEPFEQIWLYINYACLPDDGVVDQTLRLYNDGPCYSMLEVAAKVMELLASGYIEYWNVDDHRRYNVMDRASIWENPLFDLTDKGRQALKEILEQEDDGNDR